MTALSLQAGVTTSPLTTAGVWMAAAGAAFLLITAARAMRAPARFASYLGLPLASPADTGFVLVYASRTLFIGLLATILLVRRDTSALALLTALAVVMPVTDAVLVARTHGSTPTVVRHAAIATFLLVTSPLLWPGGV